MFPPALPGRRTNNETSMNNRLPTLGLLAAIAALPASAEVKINDYFSVAGYAAASATYTDIDGGGDTDTFFDSGANFLDSAKASLNAKYGDFGGSVGLLWLPGADDEAGLIEYYATYAATKEVTFTAGKFLSYLGYEAFNAPDMNQLTYGSTIYAIPAYHTGLKADYSTDTWGAGVAAVDSIYPDRGLFYGGDRDISDDIGVEAYFVWKGTEKLTLWQGIAWEDTDGANSDVFVYNIWASYNLTDALTVAGEYVYSNDFSQSFLAFAQYSFTKEFSTAFRASYADFDSGAEETKLTVSPAYKFTDYLIGRAEISYVDTDGADSVFYGAQAIFKF